MGFKDDIIDFKNILDIRNNIDKELLCYLKSLNFKERNYYIFKMFYDNDNNEQLGKIEDIISSYLFVGGQSTFFMYDMIIKGKKANEFKNAIMLNRKLYSDLLYYYDYLLNKMSILSKELFLNDSLELSIFFSYLLWNGYLSKTKRNVFDTQNRKNIMGLFFADIMDGIGVCLNHAEMLKDFLNYCGYYSACMINYHNSDIKVDNILKLKRHVAPEEVTTCNYLFNSFKRKKANHAFNLIESSEGFYVYDSTNLLIENIISPYCAIVTSGSGKTKMFPYDSYELCATSKEIDVIDDLFKANNFSSLYTRDYFNFTSHLCMDVIRNSKTLINDFYDEVKFCLDGISDESTKIKCKVRK